MAFAKEAVYHVYCKNRLSSRSNFIVFRIFKIGFQLGTTFDPALSDGTVQLLIIMLLCIPDQHEWLDL